MNKKVCIDTNFIEYLQTFQKYDVSEWFEEIYGEIIVLPKVKEELAPIGSSYEYCEKKINEGRWKEINPIDSASYLANYRSVSLDFKKYQDERQFKKSTDKADIQILAYCLTFDIPLITSNDNDFRTVISKYNYKINPSDDLEAEEVLIEVDGLLEFCTKCHATEVATLSMVKKFAKAVAPDLQKERIISSLNCLEK